MPTYNMCRICSHYQGLLRCEAFPKGIPPAYITEGDVHDHVIPGQEGDFIFAPDKTPENAAQDANVQAQEAQDKAAGSGKAPETPKVAKTPPAKP